MNTKIPSQIQVQVIKAGWFKRSYQFIADGNAIGQLDYAKSYAKKATANIQGQEFAIRRGGIWKYYIEIASTSHQPYNMRIDIDWRSKMKIMDSDRNPFVFKSTSLWRSQWGWFNRSERSLIEIKSKNFSRNNRGLIEIKDTQMKDCLFWIIVSWFVILSSEADASAAAV